MPQHTVVNLLDVEDQAPKFGMPDGVSARFARESLGLETLGVTHFKLGAGAAPPFGHKHPGGPEADEIYLVLDGTLEIKIEDDVATLGKLDAVRVPGDCMRALRGGPDGAEVVAFGARSAESELEPGWWTD